MQKKIKVILPKKLDNSCQREFFLKEGNKNYFETEKEYKKDKITLITMFDNKMTNRHRYMVIGKLNNSPWYFVYSESTTDNKFLTQSANYFTRIFEYKRFIELIQEYFLTMTLTPPISSNNPMFEKLEDQKIKLLFEDDKIQALFFKQFKELINSYDRN